MTGPTGATGFTGPTGPTAAYAATTGTTGYIQLGNVVLNWGKVPAAAVSGTTGVFAHAYVNAAPRVTLGVSGTTGAYVLAVSLTGVQIASNNDTPDVNYIAIGS